VKLLETVCHYRNVRQYRTVSAAACQVLWAELVWDCVRLFVFSALRVNSTLFLLLFARCYGQNLCESVNQCVTGTLCLLLLLLARYYGQSKPWGADVRKHMAYLTAEQALAGVNGSGCQRHISNSLH
jgi:hypothetical protein